MDEARERLAFLLETVALEAEHLQATDQRLFAEAFTPERAATLHQDALLAERLDAFSARFARLQDTAGDKLLPALLARVGEPVGSVIDNLDRASRLGWLLQDSEAGSRRAPCATAWTTNTSASRPCLPRPSMKPIWRCRYWCSLRRHVEATLRGMAWFDPTSSTRSR